MKLKIALPCFLAANLLLAVPVSSYALTTKQCVTSCVHNGQCGGKYKFIDSCDKENIGPNGPQCKCTPAFHARQMAKDKVQDAKAKVQDAKAKVQDAKTKVQTFKDNHSPRKGN